MIRRRLQTDGAPSTTVDQVLAAKLDPHRKEQSVENPDSVSTSCGRCLKPSINVRPPLFLFPASFSTGPVASESIQPRPFQILTDLTAMTTTPVQPDRAQGVDERVSRHGYAWRCACQI